MTPPRCFCHVPRTSRTEFMTFANRPLERPFNAGGNADQRRARKATRGGKGAARRAGGVVAIGRDRPAARAEIEVGARSVEGRRSIDVPGEVRAEQVLIRRRDHVRLVLSGSESRGAATGYRGAKLIGAGGVGRTRQR
jgi:hypothetical protein